MKAKNKNKTPLKKCEFCKGTGKSSYVEMFDGKNYGTYNAKDYFKKFGIPCKCPDCNGSGFINVNLN